MFASGAEWDEHATKWRSCCIAACLLAWPGNNRGRASLPAEPLLMTRGLTKTYRGLVALQDHSIVVERGEIVGVIGPNGSGKSTMFNCVTAFTRPTSGTIEFLGRSLVGKSATAIAHLGIARTFQGSRLFTSLSVFDNVAAAAALRRRVDLLDAVFGTRTCTGRLPVSGRWPKN